MAADLTDWCLLLLDREENREEVRVADRAVRRQHRIQAGPRIFFGGVGLNFSGVERTAGTVTHMPSSILKAGARGWKFYC